MEFNEKLQELRGAKKLTQEELAQSIFVSRTAISKWESGKGYPNIESLQMIAKFFGVTIDELLSSDELLAIAEEDTRQSKSHIFDMVFGLLDISVLMLLFLPFFAQELNGIIQGISLLSLTEIALYLRVTFYVLVFAIVACGILTLALQNCENRFWLKNKSKISLFLDSLALILFIISLQPYASVLMFTVTAIKVLMLIKRK